MKIKLKLICLSALLYSSSIFAKPIYDKTDMNLIYNMAVNVFHHETDDISAILCGPRQCVYTIIAKNEGVGVTTILKQVNKRNKAKKYIWCDPRKVDD